MAFFIHNIFWFLGIGAVVLIGGTWFILATGYGHRIIDWLKPNSDRYVKGKVFCEDRQIRDRRNKVGKYVISDDKKTRSFYLVHDLLLAFPGSHAKFLALSERSARPIDFHNKITPAEWSKYPSAQRVFIDTTADIRSQSSKEAANNMMAMSLSIMAMSGAIIVVILGCIVFWQNRG